MTIGHKMRRKFFFGLSFLYVIIISVLHMFNTNKNIEKENNITIMIIMVKVITIIG